MAQAAALKKRTEASEVAARSAPDLDQLIHERVRLGIVSALAANASMTFSDLKALLEVTDGNLSVHARKLEDAGYVLCQKSFQDRQPRTEYTLTSIGRQAFERYLSHMEAIVDAMKSSLRPKK
ncbi:MAG: transcriptional regulator [Bryobacteraceae bacterium]|nr:transcriptional regulator [Bryobacteraceae bacterium]